MTYEKKLIEVDYLDGKLKEEKEKKRRGGGEKIKKTQKE